MNHMLENKTYAAVYLDHILNAQNYLSVAELGLLGGAEFLNDYRSFIERDDLFFDLRDDYGRHFTDSVEFFVSEAYAQLNDNETVVDTLSHGNLAEIGKDLSEITGIDVEVCIRAVRNALWASAHSISLYEVDLPEYDDEFADEEEVDEDIADNFTQKFGNLLAQLFEYAGRYISRDLDKLADDWARNLTICPLLVVHMAQNQSWKLPL